MNNTYLDYYQQGCALGDRALQAEAVHNFQIAANLYSQAITHITYSINMAQQAGQFALDRAYYLLSFSYYRAALIQTTLGLQPDAQNCLFNSLETINKAIASNGSMFQYHSLAGDILLAQGNMMEAERAFLSALNLNQMDARSSWMLGFLYSARQQTAMANQYYQTAHQIQPNVPPIPSTSTNSSNSNWLDTVVKISTIFKNLSPSSVNIHNSNFQEGINSVMSNTHIKQQHYGSGDNVGQNKNTNN